MTPAELMAWTNAVSRLAVDRTTPLADILPILFAICYNLGMALRPFPMYFCKLSFQLSHILFKATFLIVFNTLIGKQ